MMGILRRHGGSERLGLGSRCVIGRSRVAHLRLVAPEASAEHACIYWNSQGSWEIRDLGSRNGTFVNGQPLASGRRAVLQIGDELCFGKSAERWSMVDDAPPGPIARELGTSHWKSTERGILWLDESDDDGVCVCLSEQGWVLEERGGQRVVEDGAVIAVGDRQWRLELPAAGDEEAHHSTVAASADSLLGFRFRVSRDEEQVHLQVLTGGTSIDLGVRAHHYLLLILARLRRDNAKAGAEEGEAGWVYSDELASMLALDPEHTNVLVYRARQQLRQAGVEASNLIERRPASRQMRFGYNDVEESGWSS